MAQTINTGTILFKDGTFLPNTLRFESEPCATGWRLVKDLGWVWIGSQNPRSGMDFLLHSGRNQNDRLRLRRTKEGSEGRQANPGEDELGEVQFFGNHASGLETLPGSALCESLGLFKGYPGKFVSVP